MVRLPIQHIVYNLEFLNPLCKLGGYFLESRWGVLGLKFIGVSANRNDIVV